MFPQGGRTRRMEGWKEADGRGRGQSTGEENVYLPFAKDPPEQSELFGFSF